MYNRSIQDALEDVMRQYPIVTIIGPRQSGKTTLVKTNYPSKPYFSLENPDVCAMISADPRQFLNNIDLKKGVILDEIHKYPELLSYIQGMVDENRIPGSFILTGSHHFQLTAAITQSLAGRTAILELLPLSLNELNQNYSVDDYLLRGFFPAIYEYEMDPVVYARNYIKTYLERDVRQLINIQDLQAFQKLLKLCAGCIGSTINRESLSSDIGVSQNTIKKWIDVLDISYITFQLKPYFENLGKRIIKAPKLYFTDVGLASYLLEIRSINQLNIDKMRGNLFENMVVLEMIKHQYNQGKDIDIYFYRDSHQNEVDVILPKNNKLIPIEIKSTSTFNATLLKNIQSFQKLVGDRAPLGYLIYSGDMEPRIGNIQVLNFKHAYKIFYED